MSTTETLPAKNEGTGKLNDLSGMQKAALLLVALDVETAAEVFKFLDPADVETISAEITQVKNTPSKTVDEVMVEFHNMVTAREYVLEGGLDYAQSVLEKSFGYNKATEIIEKVKNLTTLRGFDVLKRADSTQLINFLNKEHPQTIALILTHLNPEQTANALQELPPDLRVEVAFRIATLGKISPNTLKRIEKVVDEMAGLTMSQSVGKIGGTKSLAQILNRTKVSFSKELLEELMEFDGDVGVEVKRQMFLFDDIINIQDRDIQKVLREIDRKDLTLALKVADDKLKEKIYTNMSERASDLLKEELEYMGMVKLKEVESAQARIIDVVKSLEESGEISLNLRGGGSADDIYV
jgi:flagellar motor switch protein FliG